MRKKVIYAIKHTKNIYISFFYRDINENFYLFTIPYSKVAYEYFVNGKSIKQLKSYNKWNSNFKLERLIENRIPYEMKKIKQEV